MSWSASPATWRRDTASCSTSCSTTGRHVPQRTAVARACGLRSNHRLQGAPAPPQRCLMGGGGTALAVRQRSRRAPARGARRAPTRALFTGIVQGLASVEAVERREGFSSITLRFPPGGMAGIQTGASVAINGTCLTVVEHDGDTCRFDIIAESLRATNLGRLQPGSSVNYERSARMGDEIGGHAVSGHVHCTAAVDAVEESPNNRRLVFSVPPEWMKYILPKGYVAVDGCSLTVGEVGPDWFSVYLIPETLRVTVLGGRCVGDAVNIEVEAQTQAIVNTVEKVMERYMVERQLMPGKA